MLGLRNDAMPMSWYVYIVRCKDRTLYTGITNDLAQRITAHNRAKAARYTRYRRPVRLVYWETVDNRSVAAQRESLIKSWSRPKKMQFIVSARQKTGLGISKIMTPHAQRSGRAPVAQGIEQKPSKLLAGGSSPPGRKKFAEQISGAVEQ